MKKFKGLMAFALLVSVMLIGGVMAIPTITVTVQQAAMGEQTIAAPVSTANVNLGISSDGTSLVSVDVAFDQALQAGSVIYVYVLDSSGAVIGSGSATLTSSLAAGTAQTITLSTSANLASVASVKVLVLGPKV